MGFKCATQEYRKRKCKNQSKLLKKIKTEARNLRLMYKKLYLVNIHFLMASPRLSRKR